MAVERTGKFQPDGEVFTTEYLDPNWLVGNSPTTRERVIAKAQAWYSDPKLVQWRHNRLEMIRCRLPESEPGFVIDYGCLFGDCTQMLRGRWPNSLVIGMDISLETLSVASEVNNVFGALTRPGHFDVDDAWDVRAIVMADVAEHLREPYWLSILREMAERVLPGARLFCHCPIADGLVSKDESEVFDYYMMQHNHPSLKSVGYLRKTAQDTGWTVEQAGPCVENATYGWMSARKE